MSKISNLDYAALNLSRDNYLQWALDTKINLRSKELGDAIIEGNNETDKNRYRTICIIRHHLIESLKDQYLTMENPLDLWTALQRRYDHQKTVLLPKAKHEWKNLRLMDYKSVDEYSSVLFKIVSMMRLCGEEVTEKELLDKKFSTFHSTNVLLQQHEMRPIGTAALPEANEAEKKDPKECNHVHDDKRSHGKGRSSYKGHGRENYSYGRQGNHNNCGRGSSYGRGQGSYSRGRGGISKPSNSTKSACHRCGMKSLKNKYPEAHRVHDTGYAADDDSDLEKDDLLDFETFDCLKD
ncbi:uncharacterized protein LOC125586172 [Brassica napus]|uniref:uncharacterized protein LOC125586172 n=1 Tax=Brassica napus TaxID=3708 RepID=UPI00207A7BCE|nr:uncharacterized protein LOC125586172 [Brassica napus]